MNAQINRTKNNIGRVHLSESHSKDGIGRSVLDFFVYTIMSVSIEVLIKLAFDAFVFRNVEIGGLFRTGYALMGTPLIERSLMVTGDKSLV